MDAAVNVCKVLPLPALATSAQTMHTFCKNGTHTFKMAAGTDAGARNLKIF